MTSSRLTSVAADMRAKAKVRRARKVIAREVCPARWGIRHRWVFDGYFWHRCRNCGAVA